MSSTTPNLGLFKYNTTADANVAFSITKALNNNWDIIDAKCGQGNNILDFKWSDHLLNDMSWLRADTFSWQSGTTYSQAYNELLAEYNNSASTTKTEGSITFKRTPKGYKIALSNQETAVLNKYNSDGIAWYYILDTANKKFKLPRAKHPSLVTSTSTIPVVGNGMTLGITNGNRSGGIYENNFTVQTSTDTYGKNVGSNVPGGQTGLNGRVVGVVTDPTKSGLVADLSSNVKDYNMYLYFYVGGFTKSAEAQTAGLNSELLNGKQDVCIHIIDTYVNGTSWYRVYSDGWCEQGGFITSVTDNTLSSATITFLKTFNNTNYFVSLEEVKNNSTSNDTATGSHAVYNKNKNSMVIATWSWTNGRLWEAKGYIA